MVRQIGKKPRKYASQERSRATVAALVEATARILVNEGFDKASTNRIAEVAGVSVGSLYQYFPSKEALILAVAEQHNREISTVIGDALAKIETLSVEDAVRSLVTIAIEGHRVDPKLHCVLAEQIPRTGSLKELGTVSPEAHAAFRAYLESRREELCVEDLPLATFVCATSIEALAHNAVLHHADMMSDDVVDALISETTRLIVAYLKHA